MGVRREAVTSRNTMLLYVFLSAERLTQKATRTKRKTQNG
jgi:hypothetical protein